MKMKEFLIFYLFLVFFIFSLFLVLHLKLKTNDKHDKQEQINVTRNYQKKITVINTEEFEPRGRAICETANGVVYGDWMDVENAIVERKIMKIRFGKSNNFWIQYDKWPY